MISGLGRAELILVATIATLVPVLVLIGAGALLRSYVRYRVERRRDALRERLSAVLFERLYVDQPEWEAWVSTLSERERRELRRLLTEYLRLVRGTEYEQFRALGRALGMERRARRDLKRGRNRLRALTWLALLEADVDADLLAECCTTRSDLRAAAANALLAGDHPDAGERGTDLLVGDGTRPLSAFGLHTLYQLNRGDERPLLSLAADRAREWDQRVLVQVLTVLRFCQGSGSGGRYEWLFPLLEDESVRVRLAAVGAIERHGWRDDVRDRVDLERLLSDPSPWVRVGTYMALGRWGDVDSLRWLRRGVSVAESDRERLGLVRALAIHPRGELVSLPPEFEPYERWTQAERSVREQRQRHWGVATWT